MGKHGSAPAYAPFGNREFQVVFLTIDANLLTTNT